MFTKGERRGETNWEFRVNIHILIYIKYVTNKDLLYSTGNYTQYFVTTYNRKEYEKNRYICMYNNHFAVHLKPTPTHCKLTILQLK